MLSHNGTIGLFMRRKAQLLACRGDLARSNVPQSNCPIEIGSSAISPRLYVRITLKQSLID